MTLEYQPNVYAVGPCPQCGTHVAPTLLACPSCGWLVHGQRLAELAEAARSETDRGDLPSALASWRQALELLPRGSRQHEIISAKITELGAAGVVMAKPATAAKSGGSRAVGVLGTLGFLLWKLKALIFGLAKAGTFFSMLLSFAFYWQIFGWQLAVGLVLSIYVHEMGHVFALRQLGFGYSAPMFIPGLGAYVRSKQAVVNPREDAIIGLAGPIYGLGAATVAFGIWWITKRPIFAAIAELGALLNTLNLLPVWTLDGARAFRALSKVQKFFATVVVAGAYFCSKGTPQEGILLIVGILCLGRALSDKSDAKGDWESAGKYFGLVIMLSLLAVVCRRILHGTGPF